MNKRKATPQTLRQALDYGRRLLASTTFAPLHANPEASLEASLLLAHVLEQSRENLYLKLDSPLTSANLQDYQLKLKRRQNGEPLAWITGFREFWGRNFAVGQGVLCPRPESEHLVESVLEYGRMIEETRASGYLRVHDCCTGSGNLAISLALERPNWQLSASDISESAQKFFQQNNKNLAAGRINFHQCSLLEKLNGPFDIILSNPPYLTPQECEERLADGWLEPMEALNGGEDNGLGLIRRLITEASDTRLSPGGMLALEASPAQMPHIQEILFENGLKQIETRRDLAGRKRVILGLKPTKTRQEAGSE